MMSDVRHGFRALLATPGHSATVILALALAIGANAAIFSVTHAVLLRPLPFTDPERLVALWEVHPILGKLEVAAADYQDWQAHTTSFDEFAAFTMSGHLELAISSAGMEPEHLRATLASHNLFSMLGIQPQLGRTFLADDDVPGRDRVAIISHALWQRRFGSAPGVVGRQVLLNGDAYQVIGILPARLQVPDWADIWLPLSHLDAAARQYRQWHSLQVIARLKEGISLERANTDLQHEVTRLQQDYPVSNKPTGGLIVPLRTEYLGSVQVALLLLTIAVGMVLFIACVNVAHLTLSRMVVRQREIAVRLALGATQGRLVRQLLTESLLTSVIAGILGVALAAAGFGALRHSAETVLPRAGDVHLDISTLLVALILCGVATVVAGLVPAMQASRTNLTHALRESDRTTPGARTRRLHAALVTAEVALTLAVLVSAGLLAASFRHVLAVQPGFETQNLLTVRISPVPSHWPTPDRIQQFYGELLPKVRALPGVQEVAVVNTAPLTRSSSRFAVHGRPEPAAGQFPVAQWRVVTPGYFATMGIPMLQGRGFQDSDLGSARIIVNQALARRYLMSDRAVGHSLMTGFFSRQRNELPIIGVAGDVHDLGLDVPAEPTVYLCGYRASGNLLIRTTVSPSALIEPVRQTVLAVDAGQPVYDASPMEQLLARTQARRRFLLGLFAMFGALALMLAIVGIFGVVSRAATERTREVSIRVALGAAPGDVLFLIVRQQLLPVLLGLVAGTVLAALVSRAASALLFGVGAYDPATYAAANVLVFVVAIAVAAAAAVRVLFVDPARAMRQT